MQFCLYKFIYLYIDLVLIQQSKKNHKLQPSETINDIALKEKSLCMVSRGSKSL